MHPYLKIFGTQVPVYGLCMATAMLLAVLLSWLRTRRMRENDDKLLTIALFAVVCGIIGAKLLFFAVTYTPAEFFELIRENGISYLMQGGLVFYGGLIGGIIGAFIGSLCVREKLYHYSDPVVPTLPLAHAIGRLGCFFAGCCYGKVTDSWLGMEFPVGATGLEPGVKVIPTQLIESGFNLLVFVFLIIFTLRRRKGYTTLFVYMIVYGVERFLLEFLRGDEIRGFFGLLSTSQWISLALIAIGIIGLILERRRPAGDLSSAVEQGR
jgi:phosphatidylglycerol:prolipoprotein diacylglycerol transferase